MTSSALTSIIPDLVLIAILTGINAFFSSAEMAIVSVNKTKIKLLSEEGDKRAKLLEKLMNEPSSFLATIQVGITFASFFSSASAATGVSAEISKILSRYNIPYINQISLIGVTIILSYITLVFGELVPKRIALKKSEKKALSSARIIYFVSVIAKPFIKILSFSALVVLKLTKNDEEGIEEKVSEEEIRAMLSEGEEYGTIKEEEREMIDSVFEFNDIMAKEIMTSRKDTYMINIEDTYEEYMEQIFNLQYSRIPVYEGKIDNIIGILYLKDFLVEAKRVGFDNIDIRKILQAPKFIPENKRTNELFKELKKTRNHMAILIDEYGGFSGIVTMEDLIEEIMGDIEDEYDLEEPNIRKIDEKNYIVKGTYTIHEFNEFFDVELEEGDYDTINGFMITKIGEIPDYDKEVVLDMDSFILEAIEIKERRIEKVKVTIK
ncbi:hemolysin family protein [Clostridium thermobutyricum]|uniref:Magnesium and cobalt efflux protein CorC n=1 Tax=Clostridium thermobutyricum DSM 4928 TaxID=1121339 RepID=A0A1V4SZ53_9CLOT|nr:hemolysin family protein [Clostridium thermobutyricum]OPX49580.1 magnesium and cobalt efflux protein CorC [Clostridium thermobutyricum DSM 4928]